MLWGLGGQDGIQLEKQHRARMLDTEQEWKMKRCRSMEMRIEKRLAMGNRECRHSKNIKTSEFYSMCGASVDA